MTLMTERPITIRDTESPSFEDLLDDLDKLYVPDGYRAEIIKGNIVVSPWSKGYYSRVMKLVRRQLEEYLPEGHLIDSSPLLFVFPGVERAYGPDIYAAHERTLETDSNRLDGEGLSFVAELTSPSTRNDDLTDKVEVYGNAGVPVYLALDMQQEEASLFLGPYEKGYKSRLTKPFGEKLYIPDPFGCELDTAGFQAPPDES
ncbi:Uma2 family endonuclease [Streptomyces turgidiscabies]|uniref:Uma2 family endonuclease n=1 Tax=Streptomyces turgidiscabies TaxID=85558 RepID=A0ABU0RNG8_9ACTN|nr:Uma2 family endonuclease [Streptomyces turgidiscabies]MDQ0933526.1 Uma2 family endonuclease [Streptomyces turgidiscabies]